MIDGVPYDHRRHSRSLAALAATVFSDDVGSAACLVRNLSAGGALLVHGPRIPRGARIRLQLEGPGLELPALDAVVLRCEKTTFGVLALAIQFQRIGADIEELIQYALQDLEPQDRPTILVALARSKLFGMLAQQLHALERRVDLAVTALEAVDALTVSPCPIQAVVVERVRDMGFDEVLLEVLRSEFPEVRRVLACEHATPDAMDLLLQRQVQAVLAPPYTTESLKLALEPTSASCAR